MRLATRPLVLALALVAVDCGRERASGDERGGPLEFGPLLPRAHATPDDSRKILLLAEEGARAGLPAIGLRIDDVWPRFVVNKSPGSGTYLSLGGPLSETLMFVVKGYRDAEPTHAEAERLFFEKTEPLRATMEPIERGDATFVVVDGVPRPAVAFRTGSASHDDWCAIRIASRRLARQGLLVWASVGARGERASCESVLGDERLAPLVSSFRLLEAQGD